MRKNCVLIVGVGRSGTSQVARILNDFFSFDLGTEFNPRAENPEGVWEDPILSQVDLGLLEGTLTLPDWIRAVQLYESKRPQNWAYKAPILSYTLPLYVSTLATEPKVIWAYRDPKLCIESFVKRMNMEERSAEVEVMKRLEMINRQWKDSWLKLDFSWRREEYDIRRQIRNFGVGS